MKIRAGMIGVMGPMALLLATLTAIAKASSRGTRPHTRGLMVGARNNRFSLSLPASTSALRPLQNSEPRANRAASREGKPKDS